MELLMYVDLARLRRNLAEIRAVCGTDILLMVKADAYGHGMTEIARAAEDCVDMFGVATVEEGAALRACGIKKDILAAVCASSEIDFAADNGLTVAAADCAFADALAECAKRRQPPKVHVKVDTGMHRLGFPSGEAADALRRLMSAGITPEGIYSHLREPDRLQAERFADAVASARGICPLIKAHLASSSSLGIVSARYDMVRVGHAAYEGVMTVKSRVIAVRRAKAGEYVGYGRHALAHDTNLAVVFGGYFDGVRRECASAVLLRGKPCLPAGSVCMDMFAVDTGDMTAEIGEEVTLTGGELPSSEVARQRQTIDYTVMTGWHGRIKRIYT